MSVSKRSSEYSVRLLSSEYTFTKYVCLSVNEALRIVSDCYVTTCSGNISVSDQSSKCIVLLRIVNTCSRNTSIGPHEAMTMVSGCYLLNPCSGKNYICQ